MVQVLLYGELELMMLFIKGLDIRRRASAEASSLEIFSQRQQLRSPR